MKVMIVGGGSGGHIAPALAVADEIKKQRPDVVIDYVLGRGDSLRDVVGEHSAVSAVHHIFSGKFRRYHGAGWQQLLDLPTIAKNLRDAVYVVIGFFQSLYLLHQTKPDVIFLKGGFVGVPVGLAAAVWKIPFVTHDSDALPGLANRIVSRWASLHAVAMPVENYTYPMPKTKQVGIPISTEYSLVTADKQAVYKKSFGLPDNAKVIFVTGGGNGAQRLNLAVAKISKTLLARNPDLVILHLAGRGNEDDLADVYHRVLKSEDLDRVLVEPFVPDLQRYSGAADVIVTRAGATSLAQFAVQAKACIVVPNHQLTGGHQTKNTKVLADSQAIVYLSDESVQKNAELLLQQIEKLLADPKARLELARNLHDTRDEDSAAELAKLVLAAAEQPFPPTSNPAGSSNPRRRKSV